jgi:hypothetical protein
MMLPSGMMDSMRRSPRCHSPAGGRAMQAGGRTQNASALDPGRPTAGTGNLRLLTMSELHHQAAHLDSSFCDTVPASGPSPRCFDTCQPMLRPRGLDRTARAGPPPFAFPGANRQGVLQRAQEEKDPQPCPVGGRQAEG